MDAISSFLDDNATNLLANRDDPESVQQIPTIQRHETRLISDSTGRFLLIGKLARLGEGSKFGVQGDRKSAGHNWFRPVSDDDAVHDVLQLKPFDDDDDQCLKRLWDVQLEKLNAMQRLNQFDGRDYVLGKVPRETKSFLRNSDYGPTVDSSIDICWNKFEVPASKNNIVLARQNRREVRQDIYYEPRIMPLYNPLFFDLDRAKLIQNKFFDETNHLIAPWDMGSELRGGSIVAVSATLCCFDVKLNVGFMRNYELRGIQANVLKRGTDGPTDQSAPFVPEAYKKNHGNYKLDNYKGFSKVS